MGLPRPAHASVRVLAAAWLVAFSAGAAHALPPQGELARREILRDPGRNVRTLAPDWSAPLVSRVQRIPDLLLQSVKRMDASSRYAAYTPTAGDRALVSDYLSQLPAPLQQAMQEHVAGIYFVENFQGSAWCGLTLDPDDPSSLYLSMVINAETLRTGLSAWMTRKEMSAFLEDASGLRVQVNAGTKYRGLMYVLLHEGAHLLDFIRPVTPFPSGDYRALFRIRATSTPFTRGLWKNFAYPDPAYDYPARTGLRFDGLDGGTRVKLAEAPRIYEALRAGPFVSLYASTNWADDFADLYTYKYLTEKLGQPYEVSVFRGDVALVRYLPLLTEKVRARSLALPSLLEPAAVR